MSFSGKKTFALAFVFSLLVFSSVAAGSAALSAFTEGCKAYSRGDWDSSVFLLKKATAYSEFDTADTNYMLITAEIYSGDKKSALAEADLFLSKFPLSMYIPRVLYVKGKLLYNLGAYEESAVTLSDFCNRYPGNDLYPSALFYIAEDLYEGCKYDESEALYERIVSDYPDCDKVPAAQYRLDSIAQRSREEKLLYLLKQTGEEYLAAKEDYEKQLRLYNSEAVSTTRDRLVDAQQRNRDLEEQIEDLKNQIAELKEEQALKAEEEIQLRNALEASENARALATAAAETAAADAAALEAQHKAELEQAAAAAEERATAERLAAEEKAAEQKLAEKAAEEAAAEEKAASEYSEELQQLKDKARLIQLLLDLEN